MSTPLLTLLLAQYRPEAAALRRTLASVAMQTAGQGSVELILCDDGSDLDYFAESTAYLAAHGWANVQCVKQPQNAGTVKNLLAGVQRATGEYIFTLSPGDYFYDAATLSWLCQTLERDTPQVAFGRQACYAEQNGTPCQLPGDTPFDRTPYAPGAFNAKAAKRHLLLYDDGISGAALIYRRALLVEALQAMAGRVKLAEDFSVRLFAVQGVPITAYDRPLVWYELGTGVSTAKTAAAEARMLAEWQAMLDLLVERCPRDLTVRLAHAYYFNDRRRSRLVRGLVGRCIVPQNLPFKKAQKSWQPPVNGTLAALQAIYAYAQQP